MATTSMLAFQNRDCFSLFAPLFVSSNTTLLELQTLLFLFFFPKSAFPNWGCGLSKDAAYTRTFTVPLSVQVYKCLHVPSKLMLG